MKLFSNAWMPLWVVCLMLQAGTAQEQKPTPTLPELRQRLSDIVTQPKYAGALVGVKVQSLDTGRVLFEHNADKLFSPASNCKLYTVGLALDRLGADYQIRTSIYATNRPNSRGTLNSDLIVFGRGDPAVNARLNGGDIFRALEPLVAALTNAGVRRIVGDLVGDQSFFIGPEFGSGWAWDDIEYYYGAELSALTINDNILEVEVTPGQRVGNQCQIKLSPATSYLQFKNRANTIEAGGKRTISFYRPLNENVVYVSGKIPLGDSGYKEELTVHNPAGLFVTLFREALLRHGIKVTGKLRTIDALEHGRAPTVYGSFHELAGVESLPLRDLAREVQKPSQNLYTDLLLAHVGETSRCGQLRETSEELGILELNKFLAAAGIQSNEVYFEEGSGLSRNNLATPSATVKLLAFMSRHRCAEAYIAALPIAGVDGSLRNRMKGTPATGNVRAKTGSLRWSSCLSGYVNSSAGERLVFSFMLNRYDPPSGTSSRADLDAMAVLLAALAGRSSEP